METVALRHWVVTRGWNWLAHKHRYSSIAIERGLMWRAIVQEDRKLALESLETARTTATLVTLELGSAQEVCTMTPTPAETKLSMEIYISKRWDTFWYNERRTCDGDLVQSHCRVLRGATFLCTIWRIPVILFQGLRSLTQRLEHRTLSSASTGVGNEISVIGTRSLDIIMLSYLLLKLAIERSKLLLFQKKYVATENFLSFSKFISILFLWNKGGSF